MAELKYDKSWILNIIAGYFPILRKTLGLDSWNVHYLNNYNWISSYLQLKIS